MTRRLNKRDERGWRIPRPNTLSHWIYNELVKGMTARQIADRFGHPPNYTAVLVHHIKNPDKHNAAVRRHHNRKRAASAALHGGHDGRRAEADQ